MKNLNKRTKILLAIFAGVIVLAVIMLFIFQPAANNLFGTSALTIRTTAPTTRFARTTNLYLYTSPSRTDCVWTTNPANMWIDLNPTSGSFANVKTREGVQPGSSTVMVTCGYGPSWAQVSASIGVSWY